MIFKIYSGKIYVPFLSPRWLIYPSVGRRLKKYDGKQTHRGCTDTALP